MGKIIVVYGGGFQPFHAGHFSSYIQAKEKFGKFPNTEFYVTASDNTNTRPIPFKEKQWLAKQAGVSEQDFRNVAVKSPLNPVEILSQYNPDQDIFILVRSERDPVSYNRKDGTPGYYQPFVNINKCKPFNSQAGGHGYVFVTQKEEFNLAGQTVYSGTQVRNMYASADNEMRNRIVKDMYPNSPNELMIRKVLDKYIGATDAQSVAPKTVKPKTSAIKQLQANKLREQIQRIRPLLKEANPVQKYKFLKLMKESLGQIVSKEFLDGHQRSKLLMKLLDTGKYDLSDLELLTSAELVELYREEFKKIDEINFFHIGKNKPPKEKEKETSPNDYHSYFNKPQTKQQKVYHGPEEYVSATRLDPITGKKVVDEFAPPGGDDSGPDEEEILFRLAKQWWLGTEQDMIRAERALASIGWEIGEDEGYDDGGVFVVRAGDVNGKSYISWPHEDLVMDEGQTSDMRDFFKTQQPLNTAPIKPINTGPTIATVTRQNDSLEEAFDQPYDIRWSTGEFGDVDAYAELDDDSGLEIAFLDQQHNSWMVEFTRDSSTEITGEGDAYKVFATVLTAMRQFIDKRKPAKLNFSAEKNEDPTGSRASLYDKLIKRYLGGTGYALTKQDYPDGATYTLTRTEPVDEARLHFTDPNAKINVYYIPPKLHHAGKVQNLAHNIPYKLLEPFVDALLKKYKNFIPEYVVWHHVSDDPNARYGERIEESTDYLEEK